MSLWRGLSTCLFAYTEVIWGSKHGEGGGRVPVFLSYLVYPKAQYTFYVAC